MQPILAGRAVRPQDYEDWRRELWNEVVRTATTPIPPDYPDRIEMPCVECGIATQVGPRQQEMLKEYPNAIVVCLVCTAIISQQHANEHADNPDASLSVIDLGNPYKQGGQ